MKFTPNRLLIGNSTEKEELETACSFLYEKLITIQTDELNISEYGRVYLQKHQSNLRYLFQMYSFMLLNLKKNLDKPFNEIHIVDHGGGVGILSLLCKSLGMKVVYNDVYGQVAQDAKIISETIDLTIEHFHHGTMDELVTFCNSQELNIDAIVSSEVIEHVYDIESLS